MSNMTVVPLTRILYCITTRNEFIPPPSKTNEAIQLWSIIMKNQYKFVITINHRESIMIVQKKRENKLWVINM